MEISIAEKIERPESLRERVYQWMRDRILSGDLPPGESLVETQLAELLGVSRTPVHRAIGQLEQEGLITRDSRESAYVSEICDRDIREITELREILEIYVVRATATRLTRRDLEHMESILEAADQALAQRDIPGFLDANRDFHHCFDRIHGNQRICAILTNLDTHLRRILTQWGLGDQQASHCEHKLILHSIREGDVESAIPLLRDHIRACETIAREAGGRTIERG